MHAPSVVQQQVFKFQNVRRSRIKMMMLVDGKPNVTLTPVTVTLLPWSYTLISYTVHYSGGGTRGAQGTCAPPKF